MQVQTNEEGRVIDVRYEGGYVDAVILGEGASRCRVRYRDKEGETWLIELGAVGHLSVSSFGVGNTIRAMWVLGPAHGPRLFVLEGDFGGHLSATCHRVCVRPLTERLAQVS